MQQTTPQAYLIIQLGNRWTDILKLQTGQIVVIGRSSDNAIIVKDEGVSRKHAKVYPLKGGWAVEDLGSRNGTLVNSGRIEGIHALEEGETITIGACHILFSRSLRSGFSGRPTYGENLPVAVENQQTAEIAEPTIVNRRANSQWSGVISGVEPPAATAAERGQLGGDWSFFYQLIFDLVHSRTREEAAEVALDRLLRRVDVASGGVVSIDPSNGKSSVAAAKALPAMAVLATRQPAGRSYHRVSDFIVSSILEDHQGILARNIQDDSKLSFANQSAQRETVSILCAPVFADLKQRTQVVALLHIYTAGEERMLTDVDLDLVVGVADNLSIALAKLAAREELAESLAYSRRQVDELQQQLEITTEMVGGSEQLQAVRKAIQRAAPASATVLVRGESGVGKELVARAIHMASPRRGRPLICLNCAALAPTLLESELFGHEKGAFTGATERKIGKFEAADGGTLLLDEIGEMPSELQAKFLRVLEGHPFERLGGHKPIKTDVRVIAATNRDLEQAVSAKQFRADLYYRLRVIEIDIPPLRDRVGDIPPLIEFFIGQLGHHASRPVSGIEPAALEMLCRHPWPGNVRELRNVIERAIVLGTGPTLGIDDMSLSTLGGSPTSSDLEIAAGPKRETSATSATFQPSTLAELEREHIFSMLEYTEGNKSKAAQLLGIERSTLDRKLKRLKK